MYFILLKSATVREEEGIVISDNQQPSCSIGCTVFQGEGEI